MSEFGDFVRAYRLHYGLSQAKLAERVNRHDSTISRIERGTPVASQTLDNVFKEMSLPVFYIVLDYEASKVIDLRRKMLSALCRGMKERFFDAYYEYMEYSELDGIIGEKCRKYFNIMRIYLMDGVEKKLYEGFLETLSLSFPVLEILEELMEYRGDLNHSMQQKVEFSRKVLRREMVGLSSEIDLLLVNGLGIALYLINDLVGAKSLFEELLYHLLNREQAFQGEESCIPTVCYNIALCHAKQDNCTLMREVLEKARKRPGFFEQDFLVIKYRELLEVSLYPARKLEELSPLFSFPKPMYYYSMVSEVKNF